MPFVLRATLLASGVVGAAHSMPDPQGDPFNDQIFDSAHLYRRNGNTWELMRNLGETRQWAEYYLPAAIAMQGGIAAVQTGPLSFYEFDGTDWVRAQQAITRDGAGTHLEISDGAIIQGEGHCSWDGHIYQKDATTNTWVSSALLVGYSKGCDDEFRGGPVDISGEWAVVHQPYGDDLPAPQTTIYRKGAGSPGWDALGYGSTQPPEGATTFGPEVAAHDGDVFGGGSNESGTYVFRETPAYGFHVATHLRSLDSFMGGGTGGRVREERAVRAATQLESRSRRECGQCVP